MGMTPEVCAVNSAQLTDIEVSSLKSVQLIAWKASTVLHLGLQHITLHIFFSPVFYPTGHKTYFVDLIKVH